MPCPPSPTVLAKFDHRHVIVSQNNITNGLLKGTFVPPMKPDEIGSFKRFNRSSTSSFSTGGGDEANPRDPLLFQRLKTAYSKSPWGKLLLPDTVWCRAFVPEYNTKYVGKDSKLLAAFCQQQNLPVYPLGLQIVDLLGSVEFKDGSGEMWKGYSFCFGWNSFIELWKRIAAPLRSKKLMPVGQHYEGCSTESMILIDEDGCFYQWSVYDCQESLWFYGSCLGHYLLCCLTEYNLPSRVDPAKNVWAVEQHLPKRQWLDWNTRVKWGESKHAEAIKYIEAEVLEGKPQRRCFFCDKPGHSEKQCWKKNPELKPQPKPTEKPDKPHRHTQQKQKQSNTKIKATAPVPTHQVVLATDKATQLTQTNKQKRAAKLEERKKNAAAQKIWKLM